MDETKFHTQILDIIASGNTSELSKYSSIITEYFLKDVICSYDASYEGFISILSYGPNDSSCDQTFNIGFKYIIENKIIDVNAIVDDQLLVCKCIENFTGSDYQMERIMFLLDNTSVDILKSYRDRIGRSIMLYLSAKDSSEKDSSEKDSSEISDEQFESIFNKLIQMGVDFNMVGKHKYYEQTFLNDVALNLRTKFVNLALNASHDPNYYHGNKWNAYQNTPMTLLYNYRCTKDIDVINRVISIIIMFINKDLDVNYTDSDGYNLMDYVYSYGWHNVKINTNDENHDIFDINTMNIDFASYLKNKGFFDQTIDQIHYLNILDCEKLKYPDCKAYKLLFDNRYQKNPKSWWNILARLKYMKNQGDRFLINNKNKFDHLTVYEAIKISGWWENTPVLECLKETHNTYMKEKIERKY